jgi:hypothetical protein
MEEKKLSRPMTVGDEYLAAILDELKGLRADLADGPRPVVIKNGPVELREGVQAVAAVEAADQEPGAALSRKPVPAKSKERSRR